MNNGTHFAFKKPPAGKATLLQELIAFFALGWVHSAILHSGFVYEALGKGFARTPLEEWLRRNHPDETWEPEEEGERPRMLVYLESATRGPGHWYGFVKLVAMALLYPTKRFWRWIGWVPFDAWIFGEVCSVRVAEAWAAEGYYGFEKRSRTPRGLLAPVDLRGAPGFRLLKGA